MAIATARAVQPFIARITSEFDEPALHSFHTAPEQSSDALRFAVRKLDRSARQRTTGATLDHLTHRCHILEAGGESYRLRDAKTCQTKRSSKSSHQTK
ncbi:MAG: hypothetical protein ISQ06_03215 [Planctomycetaceae bacterium]|nr:hypothetical protein [Planctomycetaceae bacterium]